MIKSLSFFPSQCALNSGPVIEAVIKSLRREGIKVVDNSMDADAVLLWSVLWYGRMAPNQQIYQHYRSSGRPVIIAEIGSFHRGTTWKLAVNNITADGYYGHMEDLDWDRPRRLGIEIKRPHKRSSHILIACQNSRSLQMARIPDQVKWVMDVIDQIRTVSDRPIHVRPHPRSPLSMQISRPDLQIQRPRKVPHTYDDFDLDLACHAVVNVNSGPGILAALQHTPVVVDESSLAHPVSISMEQIESPPYIDKDQWLTQVSHTEWLVSEIEQGLWLKRLRPALLCQTS